MREGRLNPVSECRVLRLFRFRPVRKGFDAVLRDELIPDLVAFPALIDAYIGRQGPDEMGERLVASVWESRAAMSADVGEGFEPAIFHPEQLDGITDRALDVEELTIAMHFDDVPALPESTAGILRLARGHIQPGELDAYREDVRLGTLADAKAGYGPLALYLAIDPPDRFLTMSVWSSWSVLEAATGGDVRRPLATRHAERIKDWGAVHYEILPSMVHPATTITS
jgi:hypothetical protein